jgi:hypothetical protein
MKKIKTKEKGPYLNGDLNSGKWRHTLVERLIFIEENHEQN